jgi:hypothetical protein
MGLVSLSWRYILQEGDITARKEEIINKWMNQDRQRDVVREKNWRIEAREDKCCRKCGGLMTSEMKHFYNIGNRADDVLFIYRCNHCSFGEAEFNDRTVWKYEPQCSQCGAILETEYKRTDKKVLTIQKCSSCKHIQKDTLDLSEKTEAQKRKEQKQKLLEEEQFEKDKQKYCMTQDEIREYTSFMAGMRCLERMEEEEKEKEKDKKYYEQLKKIQKLNTFHAQKLIEKSLAGVNFENTIFTTQDRGKDFVVEFTTYETRQNRIEHDAEKAIRGTLQKDLSNTNWRLIKTSIECRMGVYKGRVRALETDKQIIEVLKKEE